MNNAPRQAVALRYQDSEELPTVVAKGYGEIARLILILAEKSNVPIHEDSRIQHFLSELTLGCEIEQESFKIVAEILCFLYEVDESWRRDHQFLGEIIGEMIGETIDDSLAVQE